MRLIVITTCTDRKKFPVPSRLDASTLPVGSQSAVINVWHKRIGVARIAGPATSVYSGRSFQEAVLAAKASGGDFRIISGGLGLVGGDDEIPSYSLSLVSQSAEFVGSRIAGEPFNPSHWWKGIQRSSSPSPLAKLLKRNPNALSVVGISKAYLPLIAEDLETLSDDELERLRLVGMGIKTSCPPRLQRCVLPYDHRLDGPDSPIPGTRGDFASRAMRHFAEAIFSGERGGSIKAHKSAVSRALHSWRAPKLIARPTKTDDELVDLIKKGWDAFEGKSSRGLRFLRDTKKVACEQGRFRILFQRAAREVGS
jgi:hypothetical protein